MPEIVHVKRDSTDVPFGFKIQGGSDFSVPLSILSIVPNSVADRCGLRPGDAITKINDVDVSWMDHGRAKTEIIRAGSEFYLTVERNAVDVSKPVVTTKTPLDQLKTNAPIDPRTLAPPPPAPKTDLTIEKRENINIGTSHNRAPMPFNREVGNSIDYKAAKPSNWTLGDYTQWTGGNELPVGNNQPAAAAGGKVTAVFHNPYNSPIGMYSDANIMQEFQNQTKGILPPPNMQPNHHHHHHQQQQQYQQPPPPPQHQYQPNHHHVMAAAAPPDPVAPLSSTIQSINYLQNIKPTNNQVPRGMNSLSMNMLNLGIHDAASSGGPPPSIFDLKRGNNPTGASVPRGFRSVQAPTELPPEQRRAPTRTEYQVKHIKESWVEPKIQ